ncbi:hypothetical protein PAEPH01_1931 [Pancytospora epiphaga]|nr:hypothetical protein PAEPH01_1931 [Pancytospora epiphaga]
MAKYKHIINLSSTQKLQQNRSITSRSLYVNVQSGFPLKQAVKADKLNSTFNKKYAKTKFTSNTFTEIIIKLEHINIFIKKDVPISPTHEGEEFIEWIKSFKNLVELAQWKDGPSTEILKAISPCSVFKS